MNDHECLPEHLTPINILAYMYNALGKCGCSETDEMITSLRKLLEWVGSDGAIQYDALYPEIGVFYLLAGRLDDLGLIEHGISIRFPWLTDDGKRLLDALKTIEPETIEAAVGEAYDGVYYGG